MTRIIRTIAAALNAEADPAAYRFSRGIGPRIAPKTRRW